MDSLYNPLVQKLTRKHMSNLLLQKPILFSRTKRQLYKAIAMGMLLLAVSFSAGAQANIVQFEVEENDATTFAFNGVRFNILSHTGTSKIKLLNGKGFDGQVADNMFIDNSSDIVANSSFSIKTTSNLFKVNRFWIFLGNQSMALTTGGTLTVTGRLSGITKFTQTKTTGFTTVEATTNGYTLIDLTNLNGMNYSNIIIDELRITVGGNYQYFRFDNFTWVKDSNLVLPVTFTNFSASLSKSGILKADWTTASEANNSHFILQSSQDGKTWKDVARKEAAVNGKNGATYNVEANIGTISLAGFGLLGILLLPFSNRRYRILALFALIAIVGVSCAKSGDINNLELDNTKGASNGTLYVRLAQVDKDGTTAYSETIAVKAK